jgi:hypothetical protein
MYIWTVYCDYFLLHEDRKRNIKQLCFEWMLSLQEVKLRKYLALQEVKLRKSLLKCIVDCYDLTEDRVTFGSGESFSITPDDIHTMRPLSCIHETILAQVSRESIPISYYWSKIFPKLLMVWVGRKNSTLYIYKGKVCPRHITEVWFYA